MAGQVSAAFREGGSIKSRVTRPFVFVLVLAASPGHIQAAETSRQIADSTIAAHGGMERWASAPTVYFEVEMVPAGQAGGMV
jgi:hypothetical protein